MGTKGRKTLAQRLKASGLSAMEIGAKCGVHATTAQRWLNGEREPRVAQLGKLSILLRVSCDELAAEWCPDLLRS